jgi:hypothetical protein
MKLIILVLVTSVGLAGCVRSRTVAVEAVDSPMIVADERGVYSPPTNLFDGPLEPVVGGANSGSMPGMPGMEHTDDAVSRDADSSAGDGHAMYVCPMHPDVVADGPGTCPICKMALKLRTGGGRPGQTSGDYP